MSDVSRTTNFVCFRALRNSIRDSSFRDLIAMIMGSGETNVQVQELIK